MLLKRPVTAIMLILAVLIFGGIALSNLSVNLLPEVDSPTLLVRTEWSGAAPREVEQRINEPLESVLGTVQGLQSTHGLARQGQSIISLRFNWEENMDLAFLNVREKLAQVRYLLPEQADRPQLVLVGAVKPEVQIRFRPKALDRYGLQLSAIQNKVQQANLFTATGELRDGWYRYSLKIQSRIQSLEDVRQIPFGRLGSGKMLTLRDVAEIRMAEADPSSFALVDGQRVLSVLVKKSVN